jgi:rRNA maturation protein Rpf1
MKNKKVYRKGGNEMKVISVYHKNGNSVTIERELPYRKLYFLNSPIITNDGMFQYRQIRIEEAKEIAQTYINNNCESAIGHEATAQLLSALLGFSIPAERKAISMQVDEAAIVLQLTGRLPEGFVLTDTGQLEKIGYRLGLLERIL